MMIAGLSDGRLAVISCRTMNIIMVIDAVICSTLAVNTINVIGGSRFLTAGDDGQVIVWQVEKALVDPSS